MDSGVASYSASATNFGRGATDGYYLNDPAGNVVVNNIQVNQAVTVDGGVNVQGDLVVEGNSSLHDVNVSAGLQVNGGATLVQSLAATTLEVNTNVQAGGAVFAAGGYASGAFNAGLPAQFPGGAVGTGQSVPLSLPQGAVIGNKYGSTKNPIPTVPPQQPSEDTPCLSAAGASTAGCFQVTLRAGEPPVAVVYVTTTALQDDSVIVCSAGNPPNLVFPTITVTRNPLPNSTPPSTPYFSVAVAAGGVANIPIIVSWVVV